MKDMEKIRVKNDPPLTSLITDFYSLMVNTEQAHQVLLPSPKSRRMPTRSKTQDCL